MVNFSMEEYEDRELALSSEFVYSCTSEKVG